MMQKEILTIDCLFLHDSLMSALESEQRRFRSLMRPDDPLPFGFLPPFCPCPAGTVTDYPVLGAPEARDGWILRPVSHCWGTAGPEEKGSPAIAWPEVLPRLPGIPGFILGYAGNEAEGILARSGGASATDRLTADSVASSLPCGPEGLPVRVWYHAALTAEIERDGPAFISARYEIGPARWEKRDRQS